MVMGFLSVCNRLRLDNMEILWISSEQNVPKCGGINYMSTLFVVIDDVVIFEIFEDAGVGGRSSWAGRFASFFHCNQCRYWSNYVGRILQTDPFFRLRGVIEICRPSAKRILGCLESYSRLMSSLDATEDV